MSWITLIIALLALVLTRRERSARIRAELLRELTRGDGYPMDLEHRLRSVGVFVKWHELIVHLTALEVAALVTRTKEIRGPGHGYRYLYHAKTRENAAH